ncbi:MAG: hypothetical protein KDD47_25350 [Acidobacteria bacterium]|nr:hypothetical protein [Acidobacteriota bacterium]
MSDIEKTPDEEIAGEEAPPEEAGGQGKILWGFLLALGVLAGLEGLLLLLINYPDSSRFEGLIVAFFVPGATEWLVVVPLAIFLGRRGLEQTARGLLVTAGVIALLNATCCGVVFSM